MKYTKDDIKALDTWYSSRKLISDDILLSHLKEHMPEHYDPIYQILQRFKRKELGWAEADNLIIKYFTKRGHIFRTHKPPVFRGDQKGITCRLPIPDKLCGSKNILLNKP